MAAVYWQQKRIVLPAGVSVLDGLLGAGVDVPNSCRAGVCQSCLLRATPGAAPPASQAGLKPALVEQGCFLACLCHLAGEDLHAEAPGTGTRVRARVTGKSQLSPTVLRVLLEAETALGHRPGQYLTLFREDGLARSYSIASPSEAPTLELHVRLIPKGKMSTWLSEEAQAGADVELQGPAGSCFYTAGAPDQPMLLAGTGTGLAPLYGIARDALSRGHQGEIRLFHGALNQSGLYLTRELEAMSEHHANFEYQPALLDQHGPLPAYILGRQSSLRGWRGFICGDPQIVTQLKKQLFLAGMASSDIHSDAFVPSK